MKLWNKLNKMRWPRKVFLPAAVVVVFITTYALILPAITMEKQTYCGMEEHQHTDACYTVTRELACGLEETEGHTHTEECYSTERTLVCGLEEGEDHQHTDECYEEEKVLTCGLEESEGHTHTDDCYTETRELTCSLPEHVHSSECFVNPHPETSEEET